MRAKLIVACLTASLLSACGAAQPPASVPTQKTMRMSQAQVVGPATYEAQGVPAPAKTTAGSQAGQAYQGTTGATTGTKPGTTAPAATATGKLEAEITTEKNGALFGMGTYKATVEVSNPTDQRLTGTVTITFMNGEKESKTAPLVRPVDVPANGTVSLAVEDKKWTTDSAVVEVETDAAPLTTLTAAVVSKKNGVVFGMGKFKAVVEIANPTGVKKSGTVAVTFLNKGEPVAEPVKQDVTLDPGEKMTLDFSDKHWKTDDVEVEIE